MVLSSVTIINNGISLTIADSAGNSAVVKFPDITTVASKMVGIRIDKTIIVRKIMSKPTTVNCP